MPKILLVGDSEMNRDLLSWRLSGAGFEFVSPADGDQALSAGGSASPDLIQMDLSLPAMGG